jgi:hypothetical protein
MRNEGEIWRKRLNEGNRTKRKEIKRGRNKDSVT